MLLKLIQYNVHVYISYFAKRVFFILTMYPSGSDISSKRHCFYFFLKNKIKFHICRRFLRGKNRRESGLEYVAYNRADKPVCPEVLPVSTCLPTQLLQCRHTVLLCTFVVQLVKVSADSEVCYFCDSEPCQLKYFKYSSFA